MSSSRLNRPVRRLDDRTGVTLGGGAVIETGGTAAAPSVTILGAPRNLDITGTALITSALTPAALANLQWNRPATPGPVASYIVQWSLSSSFTNPTGVTAPTGGDYEASLISAAISPLPCGVTVYFRVAAIAQGGVQGSWSGTESTTTPADTTAPAAPTSFGSSWSAVTGDLLITWVNPTSSNFAYVRVQIYASNGGALLRTERSVTGRFVWTRGMQYADTAGAYDTAVYVVLYAVSVGGTLSATALTGSPTLAAPSAPSGLTSSWASDTGTAAADCLITWTASSAAALYRLSIDGVARDVIGGRYLYTLDNNRAEHSGTPDAVLSLSLVAVDALGQSSTAATATATNSAPPATTITAFGAFSQVTLTIVASTAQDIQDYRIRVYRNTSLVKTFYATATVVTYAVEDGDGTYTFDVTARDKFAQLGTASAQTSGQAITDLAGFVTNLRSGLLYSDSLSTAADTLGGLKDGDLTTNVVTYASGTSWKWTQADWQEDVTVQTVEIAASASASYYIGTSRDGTTWTWYAAGTAASNRWQPVSQADETSAQGAATTLASGTWRVDLPAPVRCRYIRIGHRNTGASYSLREFFPATLLRGTYVQAESITAVQIAASAITADKIAAGAITAAKIDANAINGMTITGATIRTAASGARAELTSAGLKTYDSSGTVVIEATTATDGALRAGAGNIELDSSGIAVVASVETFAPASGKAVSFVNTLGSSALSQIFGVYDSDVSKNEIRINVIGTSFYQGGIVLRAVNGSSASTSPSAATTFDVRGEGVNISGGALTTTLSDAVTSTSTRLVELTHMTSGTPVAGFGSGIALKLEDESNTARDAAQIIATWRTSPSGGVRRGQLAFVTYDNAGARFPITLSADGSGGMVGFYDTTPKSKPTVSGSRGGNAALADLLDELANLGLITNSTSA